MPPTPPSSPTLTGFNRDHSISTPPTSPPSYPETIPPRTSLRRCSKNPLLCSTCHRLNLDAEKWCTHRYPYPGLQIVVMLKNPQKEEEGGGEDGYCAREKRMSTTDPIMSIPGSTVTSPKFQSRLHKEKEKASLRNLLFQGGRLHTRVSVPKAGEIKGSRPASNNSFFMNGSKGLRLKLTGHHSYRGQKHPDHQPQGIPSTPKNTPERNAHFEIHPEVSLVRDPPSPASSYPSDPRVVRAAMLGDPWAGGLAKLREARRARDKAPNVGEADQNVGSTGSVSRDYENSRPDLPRQPIQKRATSVDRGNQDTIDDYSTHTAMEEDEVEEDKSVKEKGKMGLLLPSVGEGSPSPVKVASIADEEAGSGKKLSILKRLVTGRREKQEAGPYMGPENKKYEEKINWWGAGNIRPVTAPASHRRVLIKEQKGAHGKTEVEQQSSKEPSKLRFKALAKVAANVLSRPKMGAKERPQTPKISTPRQIYGLGGGERDYGNGRCWPKDFVSRKEWETPLAPDKAGTRGLSSEVLDAIQLEADEWGSMSRRDGG